MSAITGVPQQGVGVVVQDFVNDGAVDVRVTREPGGTFAVGTPDEATQDVVDRADGVPSDRPAGVVTSGDRANGAARSNAADAVSRGQVLRAVAEAG